MRKLPVLLILATTVVWAHGEGYPSAKSFLTRGEVVKSLEDGIKLAGSLAGMDRSAKEMLLSDLKRRIEKLAEGILPETVEILSERGTRDLLGAGVVVEHTDDEYLNLLLQQRLMETKLCFAFHRMYREVVTPVVTNALYVQANIFVAAVQTSIVSRLRGPPPWFSDEEINSHMTSVRSNLTDSIGDANSYWMTAEIPKERMTSISMEFDKRLAGSRTRIARRLGVGTEGTMQEPGGLQFGRDSILGEITRPVIKIFRKESTTIRFRSLDSSSIEPTYDRVCRRLEELEDQLASNRAASRQQFQPAPVRKAADR